MYERRLNESQGLFERNVMLANQITGTNVEVELDDKALPGEMHQSACNDSCQVRHM